MSEVTLQSALSNKCLETIEKENSDLRTMNFSQSNEKSPEVKRSKCIIKPSVKYDFATGRWKRILFIKVPDPVSTTAITTTTAAAAAVAASQIKKSSIKKNYLYRDVTSSNLRRSSTMPVGGNATSLNNIHREADHDDLDNNNGGGGLVDKIGLTDHLLANNQTTLQFQHSVNFKSMDNVSENSRNKDIETNNLTRSYSLRESKTSLALTKTNRLRIAKEMVEEAIKQNKIFTIIGPYQRVRECLRNRGWVEKFYKLQGGVQGVVGPNGNREDDSDNNHNENEDQDGGDTDDGGDGDDSGDDGNTQGKTMPWDEDGGIYGIMSRMVRNYVPTFIWSLKKSQVDFRYLRKEQIVNHHSKAGSFTTKVGLCRHLRQMPWFVDETPDDSFPRCYILSVDDEKQEFIDEFRLTACMALVKIVASSYSSSDYVGFSAPSNASSPVNPTDNRSLSAGDGTNTNTTTEPQTARKNSKKSKTLPKIRYEARQMSHLVVPHETIITAIQQCDEYLRCKNHEDIDNQMSNFEMSELAWEKFLNNYYLVVNNGATIEGHASKKEHCANLVKQLREVYPQFDMDGVKNIWIVKPGAKSRGRGIMCYNNLDTMVKLVSGGVPTGEGKYVVQKYIERPFLVYNTKFDIRQWFLVSEWNPLTVWWYKDCYLRFCSQQFTLEDFNESVHLSNNSIQYKYENGPRSSKLPSDNMWDSDDFAAYLRKNGGGKVWQEVIQPGMKRAVVAAMLCTQDSIDVRKNCFELYGADFMISEDLRPWLIEINASPCMAPSTSVTARMTADVLEDTIKVVLDRRKDRNCNVGGFELIYKQTPVTVPPYVGIDLTLTGRAYKRQWNSQIAVERQDVPKNIVHLSLLSRKTSTGNGIVITTSASAIEQQTGTTATTTTTISNSQNGKTSKNGIIMPRALSQNNISTNNGDNIKESKILILKQQQQAPQQQQQQQTRNPVVPSIVALKRGPVNVRIGNLLSTTSSEHNTVDDDSSVPLSPYASSGVLRHKMLKASVNSNSQSIPNTNTNNDDGSAVEITEKVAKLSYTTRGATRVEIVDLTQHHKPILSNGMVTSSSKKVVINKVHKSYSGKTTSSTSKKKSNNRLPQQKRIYCPSIW